MVINYIDVASLVYLGNVVCVPDMSALNLLCVRYTGWLGIGWWLSSTEDDIIEAIVLACVDFLAVSCSLFVNRNGLVVVSECGASASEISFNDSYIIVNK